MISSFYAYDHTLQPFLHRLYHAKVLHNLSAWQAKIKSNIKIKKVLHTFCHLFSIQSFSFLNLFVQFCCFWFTFVPFWTPCFYIATILRLFACKPKLAVISFKKFLRRVDIIIWFLQQVWNEKVAFSAICSICQIQKRK